MVKILSKKKSGFTLVESLVAITVFLVVVTAVSSIYISFVRQERRLYDFLKTENNIRFALDYIGRDIRMAHDFGFDNNFQEQDPAREELTFDDYTSTESLKHSVTYSYDKANHNITVSRDNGTPLFLLDPSIKVSYLQFYTTNGTKGSYQPTVIIVLEAIDKNDNKYSLETAITPRNLNLSQ